VRKSDKGGGDYVTPFFDKFCPVFNWAGCLVDRERPGSSFAYASLAKFSSYASDVRKPMRHLVNFPDILSDMDWNFTWMSVYDGRKNLRVTDEMTSVTMGSLLAGVCTAGMLYITYRDISRVLFLAFILIAYISLAGWRLAARILFKLSKGKAFSIRRVLIVGAGQNGREFKEKITAHSYLGVNVAGF
jgi:FlaA1/EpsC-like NDP-sugar epimerase